ncbi:hypothetical protein K439DRAFT_1625625 [Ramaria rubella]|nr:hypothetical protein K439DRAFT_1625625 [Ramaria rubella]
MASNSISPAANQLSSLRIHDKWAIQNVSQHTAAYHVMQTISTSASHFLASLLGEIFLLCAEIPGTPLTRDIPPLLFIRISRHWRDVALKTPRLWCDLVLSTESRLDPYLIIPLFLRHSSAVVPLRIIIETNHASPIKLGYPSVQAPYLRALSTNAIDLLGSLSPSFPYLKHIRLQLKGPKHDFFSGIFATCPALEELIVLILDVCCLSSVGSMTLPRLHTLKLEMRC